MQPIVKCPVWEKIREYDSFDNFGTLWGHNIIPEQGSNLKLKGVHLVTNTTCLQNKVQLRVHCSWLAKLALYYQFLCIQFTLTILVRFYAVLVCIWIHSSLIFFIFQKCASNDPADSWKVPADWEVCHEESSEVFWARKPTYSAWLGMTAFFILPSYIYSDLSDFISSFRRYFSLF